jgi:hypothetical protein
MEEWHRSRRQPLKFAAQAGERDLPLIEDNLIRQLENGLKLARTLALPARFDR